MSDASNALFFIAGLLCLPRWAFIALVSLSIALDFGSIHFFGTSDFCVSPAYGFLWVAYGVLWLAGQRLSRVGISIAGSAALIAAFLGVQLLCHLISSGSFYFLSGRFADPSFAGLIGRVEQYLPSYLLRDLWYLVFFLVIRVTPAPTTPHARQEMPS